MKGFILAAGLGTRLKPWTDHHPKALVPVGGVPMLQRVVEKMHKAGITDITVNCFHFANQIKDFIREKGWEINVVDETPLLLETGGAILNAAPFLEGDEPILVHNVDILSNADFDHLEGAHIKDNCDATLLVSDRVSSRKLIFNSDGRLVGWHSLTTDEFRPAGFKPSEEDSEMAFSGIYVISPTVISKMKSLGWKGRFSIIDFFLSSLESVDCRAYAQPKLQLIDIGKPDALEKANGQSLLL